MPKLIELIGTGNEDPDALLRKLLTRLIRRSGKSREQIAEQLSLHAGFRISKHTVHNWKAKGERGEGVSRRQRFPAFLIPIFCQVVGNDELQRWAAGQRLVELAEFGEHARKMLSKRKSFK